LLAPNHTAQRRVDCLNESEGKLPSFQSTFVMWPFVVKLGIHHVFQVQSSLLQSHVDISAPARSTYRCIHSV